MSLPTDVAELHKMIEELRKENADRRVKSKAYDETFKEYNDEEREFLLDIIRTTATDQEAGAKQMRDLAFRMIGDSEKFLDGLDVPKPDPQPEEKEEEADVSLTPEQLQAILDERDQKAQEAARQAETDAGVEEIFKEIEGLGLERGTPAFMTALNVALAAEQSGEEVDFKQIVPKVATSFGVELPAGEGEGEGEEGEDSGSSFPSTTDANGGPGAPVETPKDWVEEAKAAGKNPLTVARERAEARLESA